MFYMYMCCFTSTVLVMKTDENTTITLTIGSTAFVYSSYSQLPKTFGSLREHVHCILFYRKDNSSLSGRDEKPRVPEPLVLCIPMRRQRCCEVTAVLQFARQVFAGQVVAAQLFDGEVVDWQFQFVCEQFLSRVVALAVSEVLLIVPSRKPALHNTPHRIGMVNMTLCVISTHKLTIPKIISNQDTRYGNQISVFLEIIAIVVKF